MKEDAAGAGVLARRAEAVEFTDVAARHPLLCADDGAATNEQKPKGRDLGFALDVEKLTAESLNVDPAKAIDIRHVGYRLVDGRPFTRPELDPEGHGASVSRASMTSKARSASGARVADSGKRAECVVGVSTCASSARRQRVSVSSETARSQPLVIELRTGDWLGALPFMEAGATVSVILLHGLLDREGNQAA